MEKKPEVDGAWIDCGFSQLLQRRSDLDKAVCVAVSCPRIEMAGDDLAKFKEKLARTEATVAHETSGMTDEQRSFYVLRRMLVE